MLPRLDGELCKEVSVRRVLTWGGDTQVGAEGAEAEFVCCLAFMGKYAERLLSGEHTGAAHRWEQRVQRQSLSAAISQWGNVQRGLLQARTLLAASKWGSRVQKQGVLLPASAVESQAT